MADWRQIHARIRKAKASKDPAAQLSDLFQRTRDAMVAFELAQWYEKSGASEECVRWYTTAAEHFRRPQWRTKAEEALTRLGAPIPVYLQPPAQPKLDGSAAPQSEEAEAEEPDSISDASSEPSAAEGDASSEEVAAAGSQEAPDGAPAAKKRRRRGRRGGRNRRKGPRSAAPGRVAAAGGASAEPARSGISASESVAASAPILSRPVESRPVYEPVDSEPEPPARERSYEPAAAGPSRQGRSRAGEPALASRIAQLESNLRRLLACPLASLDDSDQAPAGPGVLLLSDSDQVTHYYVEACQTLRIAIGNLLRGGRGSKEGGRLKASMAENLGIVEARVSKYLKDHCVVRWIQLDEGAPEMAHFAIAVLHPVVNE